jgi:probable HAF family extracellular repeat protein
VGYSTTAAGFSFHAFLWEAGSGMQDLGTLGGDLSLAVGINSLTADREHAVRWDPGPE